MVLQDWDYKNICLIIKGIMRKMCSFWILMGSDHNVIDIRQVEYLKSQKSFIL